jgi:cytochrome oxidase Cu insertion factor (SCO1/SenC/PrrC family)
MNMKRTLLLLALSALLAAAAAAQTPAPPVTHLKAGMPAPEFSLTDTAGKTVKLSDFKGKKTVVLAFYVFAFTGG